MPEHEEAVRSLFGEYLRWVCPRLAAEYGAIFDPETMIVRDMEHVDIFLPPRGILLLAFDDESLAGCACTRRLDERVAELKRMYVRPSHRRRGIGARLVKESILESQKMGFSEMRLDSARFMSDAHQVYRAHGFQEIPPYDGSEIPPHYRANWIFMRRDLAAR